MGEQVQRVAAYAVCIDADRLLLCRLSGMVRAIGGQWTLPGGGIDFGEHPEVAVVREMEEETGLTGEVRELLGVDSIVFEFPFDDGTGVGTHHALRVVYRVTITGGELRDEVSGSSDSARWFTRHELDCVPLVDLAKWGVALGWATEG